MQVIKRNGVKVPFDARKIEQAIRSANGDVDPVYRMSEAMIVAATEAVTREIASDISVEEIQDLVITQIMKLGAYEVAKHFIEYRYQRSLARMKKGQENTTDEAILELIHDRNKEMREENSNKNTSLASTQRDYIAGIVSRDMTKRLLLPEHISKAHEEGILHFHDMDYFVEPIFNCCLLNLGDMLQNGVVMNGKMIESPKSFQVACTVMTQIISNIASNQYGGQSVAIRHLAPFLRKSKDKIRKRIRGVLPEEEEDVIKRLVEAEVKAELQSGVQTIQYQINTLMTTNG